VLLGIKSDEKKSLEENQTLYEEILRTFKMSASRERRVNKISSLFFALAATKR